MRNSKQVVKLFGGILLGGLVAAGVTLLMAPQSGEQTRHKIQENLTGGRTESQDGA